MNQSLFCHSFCFSTIVCENEKHSGYPLGAPYHFIARMKSGTGVIRRSDGEQMHLKAGDVFYLPLGLAYRSHWSPDKERRRPVSFESYGFVHLPTDTPVHHPMQILTPSPEALSLLDRLEANREVTSTSVGLLYLFLGELLPLMRDQALDAKQILLQRATAFIAGTPDLRVGDLAKHLNMSESALFSFFREHAHTTPVKLRQQILAERAAKLLTDTDRSVEEIAASLGFCSAAHLRKTVKAVTGKTPSQIRKAARYI